MIPTGRPYKMPATPKLASHSQTVTKFDKSVDAYIFINPDTNEEYTILGAGVIIDDPLEGTNTYASVSEHLDTPANVFGFIPTTRIHRFEKNEEFVPDYVVPITNPVVTLLFGISEVPAMRIK